MPTLSRENKLSEAERDTSVRMSQGGVGPFLDVVNCREQDQACYKNRPVGKHDEDFKSLKS